MEFELEAAADESTTDESTTDDGTTVDGTTDFVSNLKWRRKNA